MRSLLQKNSISSSSLHIRASPSLSRLVPRNNSTANVTSSRKFSDITNHTSFLFTSKRMSSTNNDNNAATAGLSLYAIENPNLLEQALRMEVLQQHDDAVRVGANTYIDPDSGYTVFCRKAHIERGKCCGSGCRHCPYGWANVPAHRKPKAKPAAAAAAATAATAAPSACCPPVPDVEDTVSSPSSPASSAIKKSRVYTRTGDKGKSSLFTGERRSKTDLVFDTLGTVDELMSCIGVAKEYLRIQQQQAQASDDTANTPDAAASTASSEEGATITTAQVAQIISVDALEHIQQLLMDIGTIVATPTNTDRCNERAKEKVSMYEPMEWVKDLERQIDLADSFLPPITVFILPGGGLASAHLHLARSTCRRAERCMLAMQEDRGGVYDEALLHGACKFVNRLSDFLFVAARAVALHADVHRSAPNGGKQNSSQ